MTDGACLASSFNSSTMLLEVKTMGSDCTHQSATSDKLWGKTTIISNLVKSDDN
jgi:hypothetical protein